MTLAVDLGRKATKQTNKQTKTLYLMDFPSIINWTNSFQMKGLFDIFLNFVQI